MATCNANCPNLDAITVPKNKGLSQNANALIRALSHQTKSTFGLLIFWCVCVCVWGWGEGGGDWPHSQNLSCTHCVFLILCTWITHRNTHVFYSLNHVKCWGLNWALPCTILVLYTLYTPQPVFYIYIVIVQYFHNNTL